VHQTHDEYPAHGRLRVIHFNFLWVRSAVPFSKDTPAPAPLTFRTSLYPARTARISRAVPACRRARISGHWSAARSEHRTAFHRACPVWARRSTALCSRPRNRDGTPRYRTPGSETGTLMTSFFTAPLLLIVCLPTGNDAQSAAFKNAAASVNRSDTGQYIPKFLTIS
jgi:hypothetical protein